MEALLNTVVFHNLLWRWAAVFAAAIVAAILLICIRSFGVRWLTERNRRAPTRFVTIVREFFASTSVLWLVVLSLYIGSQFVELPPKLDRLIDRAMVVVALLQVGLWGTHAIRLWLGGYVERTRTVDAAAATTVGVFGFISQLVLWTLLLLLCLQNLGFNVTTLVAGLGVGGVAVALAAQNILGDLFASLSIVLDKPFVIGDFVVSGDIVGSIEYVGMKSTRIRSLSGEQIIVSNTEFLKGQIHNFKRMLTRRILFGFGVTYDTPADKLEKIPQWARAIVEAHAKARFDRAHFKAFGASSIDYEVVYIVEGGDYNLYMDIQQGINLAIFRKLESEGVDFAFPTQTVLLQRAPRRDGGEPPGAEAKATTR